MIVVKSARRMRMRECREVTKRVSKEYRMRVGTLWRQLPVTRG